MYTSHQQQNRKMTLVLTLFENPSTHCKWTDVMTRGSLWLTSKLRNLSPEL